MAVAFDANATANAHNVSVAQLDLTTLTVGSGSNRALVAQICYFSAPTTPAVVWDPTGANQSLELVIGANASDGERVELWGLVNPTSGAKTLRLSLGESISEVFLHALSVTGAHQTGGTTTFANANSATATSASPSLAITSAVGDLTVDALVGAQVISAPTQTQTFIDNGGSFTSGAGSRADGAASVTHGWTLGGSVLWVQAGCSIVAAGGGGGGSLTDAAILIQAP